MFILDIIPMFYIFIYYTFNLQTSVITKNYRFDMLTNNGANMIKLEVNKNE